MVGFPITYGDENVDKVMLSDSVVELMKNEKFQNYVKALGVAVLALGSYARPSSAIPAEYGEAANEALNQAAQNGAAAGAAPPIGPIKGQVPVPANQQGFIPAMPIEQQRMLAAQQTGVIGPGQGPAGIGQAPGQAPAGMDQVGPTNHPAFYIPHKPGTVGGRTVNTIAFTTAMGIICLNAAWGEPTAIWMCSSGLVALAYNVGREVVIFMAKNMK
jgi:hypothetical protein